MNHDTKDVLNAFLKWLNERKIVLVEKTSDPEDFYEIVNPEDVVTDFIRDFHSDRV